jgi:hypothetical protein
MAMASKVSIDLVADDAIVLVPLFNIEDGAIDFGIRPHHVRPAPGSPPAQSSIRQVHRILSGGGVSTFPYWNLYQVSPTNPPMGCKGVSRKHHRHPRAKSVYRPQH